MPKHLALGMMVVCACAATVVVAALVAASAWCQQE